MKAAILAGGRGTRLGGQASLPPKPLTTIGGEPILWHVLQLYRRQAIEDFVIAIGYRGAEVVEWFRHLAARDSTLDLLLGEEFDKSPPRPGRWRVVLADTGTDTANGSRLAALRPWLSDGPFLLSWCDGVTDLDLSALRQFHLSHGKLASIVAVHPPSRFGRLELDGCRVAAFAEKPLLEGEWINGGFFLLEPSVLDRLSASGCHFELGPLPKLAAEEELMAFRHEGFWACMDTQRDREHLEDLWRSGRASWTGNRRAA